MPELLVTYDLHVKRRGRWTIEATYELHERDLALLTARRRAMLLAVEATKLVRDCYNVATGLTSEAIVYNSARATSRSARLREEAA